MKENLKKYKSFDFGLRIIKLYKFLLDKKEFVLSKQLLRSGTTIDALVREAECAESKLDFIHKMAIALKETNETAYWIELLHRSQYIADKEFQSILNDTEELLRLLTAIIKTSKINSKK